MLVIKIELWPGGNGQKAQEIGRLHIINRGDHPDTPRRGNYAVKLLRRGSRTSVTRTAEVNDYARLAYPVWKLVRKALEALDV
jgi:hypothetical protein